MKGASVYYVDLNYTQHDIHQDAILDYNSLHRKLYTLSNSVQYHSLQVSGCSYLCSNCSQQSQ